MQEVSTAAASLEGGPVTLRNAQWSSAAAVTCFSPAAWCRAWSPPRQGALQACGTVLFLALPGCQTWHNDWNTKQCQGKHIVGVPLQAGSQGHMHCCTHQTALRAMVHLPLVAIDVCAALR